MSKKLFEDLTEMLQDQMKKIAKKSDITPQELDNVYKAIDVMKDIETIKAMQEAGEEGGYSQEGYSQEGYSNRRGVKGTGRGRYSNDGYSQHYPIYPPMMFDGTSRDGSYDGNSYAGGSYSPVWNQNRNTEMHGGQGGNSNADGNMSNNQGGNSNNQSMDYSNNSYNYSNRRGRDARTGRYVSRDRGYSRADEKEHMLDRLEDMLDDASSERERRAIEQCIERISK